MIQNTSDYQVTPLDRKLLAAIQGGLPLDPHPYAVVGEEIGISEAAVVEQIEKLQQHGVIRRMGVIVHHRPLGYSANAMVVWNLPTELIETFGNRVSPLDFVTLCYQRRPSLPAWPYTLYTMIHGKDRESVLAHIETLKSLAPVDEVDYQVLFSSRRFKQQGARYFTNSENTTQPQPEMRMSAHS